MKALILAGGLGTRLRSVAQNRPKPMVDILGRPFLSYILEYLRRQDINQVVLCIGYKGEYIEEYFGSGRNLDMSIEYVHEQNPAGTGGALVLAKHHITETTLVLNGDTYYQFDMQKCYREHKAMQGKLTLVCYERMNPVDVGVLDVMPDGRVRTFCEKQTLLGPAMVSCGVYLVEPDIVDCIAGSLPLSFETQVLPQLISQSADVRAINVTEDFYDIGTPERYSTFVEYARKNLLLPQNERN